MGSKDKFLKGIFFILLFFAVVLAGMLLKMMESVFKPLVLSVFLAFVFYPFIKKLTFKLKLPWWLSTVLVYLISFVILVFITNMIVSSFKSVAAVIPKYEERFLVLQQTLLDFFGEDSSVSRILGYDDSVSVLSNISNQIDIMGIIKNAVVGVSGFVVGLANTLMLVVLMSVFLLTEFKMMKKKINVAFDTAGAVTVYEVVQKIISDVTNYVSIKFLISFATGILVFVICLCFGMDFPLVWGFFAFCFNFIPTFGSILSCCVTAIFALIQFYPTLWIVVVITILVGAVNFVLGNVVEPKIEGDNLDVSPFVILVSLSLWGWIWGVLGMILSVPFMVIIKIVCENVSYLKPVAVFLGAKAKKR